MSCCAWYWSWFSLLCCGSHSRISGVLLVPPAVTHVELLLSDAMILVLVVLLPVVLLAPLADDLVELLLPSC